MQPYLTLVLSLFALFQFNTASAAIHTTASFDANYAVTQLTINSSIPSISSAVNSRTLSSYTGYEIDYNVSLFDYRTIATLSFAQFLDSNVGRTPLTRIALGASYHFIRMNGERVILDNQVETKAWGISPAVELSFGLSSFSPSDPTGVGEFTASLFDVHPRLLVEVPINPTFLLLFRAGYLKSLSLLSNTQYSISYSGYVFSIGVKLTTL